MTACAGWRQKEPLVLASTSAIRADLLKRMGVGFEITPSGVDEDEVKARFSKERAETDEIAAGLASVKARNVSLTTKHHVIGADQTMDLHRDEDPIRLDKPKDAADLKEALKLCSGCDAILYSGVAIAKRGRILWRDVAECPVRYRSLSEAFIADYAERWPDAEFSLGGFLLEDGGARILKKAMGDPYAVMGLPLFSLVTALTELSILEDAAC